MHLRLLITLLLALTLAACGGTPKRELPVDDLPDTQAGLRVDTVWSANAGRGIHSVGDALVLAVRDDRVYVADRRGRIGAWRLDDGRRLSRTRTGLPVSGGPAVSEDLIVVGTRDGRVTAINADSEETLWEARVSSEVLSVPAISDNSVYVLSGDGRLYAFRRDTGARRWTYDRPMPPLTLRGTSSPVLVRDWVLAGLPNGRLVAVNRRDGSMAWEVDVGIASGTSDLERMRDVVGDPVLHGDEVFVVGYRGRALSLDLQHGRTSWNRDLSSYSGLAVDDERVYITEANGRVWALDRHTGAAVWRQDDLEGIRGSAPVAVGDVVAVGDDRGRLTLLDTGNGELLARVSLERKGSISRAPVVIGDDLLVLTDGGRLLRLSLSRR